jgi:hypothetical protein
MGTDLISKKTRHLFQEWLVGYTLREITTEFDNADLEPDLSYMPEVFGQRRSLVAQYHHAIDFSKWSDVRKLLRVYESIMEMMERRASNPNDSERESIRRELHVFAQSLERDGFDYKQGVLTRRSRAASLEDAVGHATKFDAPELQRQLARIRDSIDDDPSLAIGTAKELVETACKTILTERGKVFDSNAEIHVLVKAVRAELGLLPEDIGEAVRGSEVIKRLLSQLGAVAQSLGELRNLYGTGHGRAGKSKGLDARHARLAVGAASTLAVFLFETHSERTKSGSS